MQLKELCEMKRISLLIFMTCLFNFVVQGEEWHDQERPSEECDLLCLLNIADHPATCNTVEHTPAYEQKIQQSFPGEVSFSDFIVFGKITLNGTLVIGNTSNSAELPHTDLWRRCQLSIKVDNEAWTRPCFDGRSMATGEYAFHLSGINSSDARTGTIRVQLRSEYREGLYESQEYLHYFKVSGGVQQIDIDIEPTFNMHELQSNGTLERDITGRPEQSKALAPLMSSSLAQRCTSREARSVQTCKFSEKPDDYISQLHDPMLLRADGLEDGSGPAIISRDEADNSSRPSLHSLIPIADTSNLLVGRRNSSATEAWLPRRFLEISVIGEFLALAALLCAAAIIGQKALQCCRSKPGANRAPDRSASWQLASIGSTDLSILQEPLSVPQQLKGSVLLTGQCTWSEAWEEVRAQTRDFLQDGEQESLCMYYGCASTGESPGAGCIQTGQWNRNLSGSGRLTRL